MTPEQYEKMIKPFELKADFYAPDQVIVKGVTPAYAEYQKELFRRRFNELYGSIVHTIDTLEARRSEHLGVIDNLMRENKSLRDKLKEQTKGANEMNQEDIEKAWALLSMHNSELLLERAELLERLRNQSIWEILKARWRNMFRRGGW